MVVVAVVVVVVVTAEDDAVGGMVVHFVCEELGKNRWCSKRRKLGCSYFLSQDLFWLC